MDRSDLITAFQDTLARSTSSILKKKTELAVQSSRVYLEGFCSKQKSKRHMAEIIVEENTSFAAARKYLAFGKTAVLNFANPENPGGGVQNGAMAQEECLCRSSNLYLCLAANIYPDYYLYHRKLHNHFYSDRLIYTEGVTVFKDDNDVPNMLDENEWFQVDVITCAAPFIAKRRHTNKAALKALFKTRIQNIFEAAIEHNIDVLILGAFGCGAFKNPPGVVAKAFKEVIDENGYKERFSKIVFAIKSTVNGNPLEPCPNIMAFEIEFYKFSGEENKLRFSDNYGLAQAAGSIKMPSGKVLKGGEKFNPFQKWQRENKYFGKQFSIFGDSISTLEGYNPKGYSLFYTDETCDRTGVHDMKDTWWGKVIDYVGGELLVNNSWSGSRVTKLPKNKTLFPSGCSAERTKGLHIGSVMPDVIIVYLGTNDWAYGAQAEEEHKGFYDDRTGMFVDGFVPGDESVFSVAYLKMLESLRRNYPNAEIYCCTLNETYMASNPSFHFPHAYGGTHIERYNNIIRSLAPQNGCKVIDLYDAHLPYDAVDGTHPTAGGMDTLATLVLHGLCDREGLTFLECPDSEHEFVTAEEYTGGTKYVCRKCGLVSHSSIIPNKAQEADAEKKNADSDVIDLNPNCTALLFSAKEGIRLFRESREEDVRIYKTEFLAGRNNDCDLHMTGNAISQIQATFLLDGDRWLLYDNDSANGTWLNETKLIPGKKYVLHPDDIIDFAHAEEFIFFKTYAKQQEKEDLAKKSVALLEAGIKIFYDSDYKDETALKLIVSALVNAPLYLPVTMDLNAMLGNTDPAKLKPGDTIQLQKDVPAKILTITVQNTEYIPMFTSEAEANKGPSVSMMRMSPQMYLPKIIGMDKEAVINPFGGTPFIMKRQLVKDLLFPMVLQNVLNAEDSKKDKLLGQQIDGKYVLLQLLGRSGLVRTYLGKDSSGKRWTVKICDKSSPNFNENLRISIIQEAHMMMKFDHPAIPKVENLIENEKHIVVVREYIEGSTLYEKLTQNGTVSESEARNYFQKLAAVLQYMHSFNPPYIYRDMKPMNVIITVSGDVKLIDFGICEAQGNSDGGISKGYGTKGYAAPEQFMGKYDPRTDIYGLGITIHQMITGISPKEPPCETLPVRQTRPEISRGMEYIIQKCIASNPDERYPNCGELLFDLDHVQNLPPKKGLFANLFGKKEKKSVNTAPPINQTVARLYAGMNKEKRDQLFYGGPESAQDILLRLADSVFHSTSDEKIELCMPIYLQTWIRTREGFPPHFSTPSSIKEALIQRFSSIPSPIVIACVEQSLDIIYFHEPQLKQKAAAVEELENILKATAAKNVEVQDLYLKEEDYGLVIDKPVFVNGFGEHKYYLSHLSTIDGVNLSFERIGSSEVKGISGPVDAYKLLLPDQSLYMTIFICNYGTRTTHNVPKGLVCTVPVKYYFDNDSGAIVRFYDDCDTEMLNVNSQEWRRLQPDNNYMREIMIGQGNNCLTEITEKKANEIIQSWQFPD